MRGADVVFTFWNASDASRSDVASITRRVALSSSDRHAFVIAPGRSRRSLSHKSRKATQRPWLSSPGTVQLRWISEPCAPATAEDVAVPQRK